MKIVRIIWAAAILFAATAGVHAQEVPASPDSDALAPLTVETTQDATEAAPAAKVDEVEKAAQPAVAPKVDPTGGMTVQPVTKRTVATLGSIAPNSPYKIEVELTPWGAGIQRVTLADYYTDTSRKVHYTLMSQLEADNPYAPRGADDKYRMYAFSAKAVTINGHTIDLQSIAWDLQNPEDSTEAHYSVTILGPDGGRLLRIDRRFKLAADSYSLECEQKLTNLATAPLKITWQQFAHGDVTSDTGYLGDRRELVGGYHDLDYDPNRRHVYTKDVFLSRVTYLKDANVGEPIWPNKEVTQKSELVWLSTVNRYFVASLYRPLDNSNPDAPQTRPLSDVYPTIGHYAFGPNDNPEKQAMAFTLDAAPIVLQPEADSGTTLDLSLYVGPRMREVFATAPYSTLQLDQLIVYQLGCTWCTFQFLAKGLLWFLRLIEGDIISIGGVGIGLHDWGLSIIVLVLVVRLILHPITKNSQIRMAKMGRQMKSLQPELARLKKKYKDDQKTYNAEMMKLYKERNVSPFNMLGCLPMLMQTPIWIALYAMLYYAIELRQEPAFYGLFQHLGTLVGINWQFLSDLSKPDTFIHLGSKPIPLNLFIIHLDFQTINILPLLMGVTFFFQQRISMANNTASDSNEPKTDQQKSQEQMQKTMMWMMPILFPIMMYSVPSGLTLYIMASTLGGIIDSYIVRKHIREEEAAGTLLDSKPRVEAKPGSLKWRVQQWAQQKMAQVNEIQNQQQAPRDERRSDRPKRGR